MTVTLHRLGSVFYNFAAYAQIDVDPSQYHRPGSAKAKAGPCVELLSVGGHRDWATGDEAEALIDYLEGRSVVTDLRIYSHATLAVATVSAPEPATA